MIKQTRNAMHMLIEAYKAVYNQAMYKGAGIKCSGSNALKLLLILASVGSAQASTSIKMPWGERALYDITPNITEIALTNNSAEPVTATGNLGHEMSWMLLEAYEHSDGENELKADITSEGGIYQNAVNLLNQATFQNVTTNDLSAEQNIVLNSIEVNGGLVNLQPGYGSSWSASNKQTLTITGTTNVNKGFLYLGNNATDDQGNFVSSTTAQGLVTYKGISTGQISGDTTFSSGLVIEDYAAVDVGRKSNIKGNITIKSKGPSDINAFTEEEKQYGVWGKSVSDFLEKESETTGGLNVGHGESTITGEVTIDGGKLTVVDFADVSSEEAPAPELTITENVTVTNAGEIYVMGTQDTNNNQYHAKLTIENDLNVSGKKSLVSVGSINKSEAQGELIVNGKTTVDNGGKIIVGQNGTATFNGAATLDGTDSITIKEGTNGKLNFK